MIRVLIPSGALGLGYERAALDRGIAARPDIIAIDGGSTDSGPSYLGRGVSKYSRASTKVEWRGLLEARARAGVPLVLGTAGTCGADSAVDWLVDITKEIAVETDQHLKIAVLKSGQSPETVTRALREGRITPLKPAPEIDEDLIASCTNIVALAGAEQIAVALATGADVVIAGRTTDTAIIASLPLSRGCNPGGAWHGAKVGECGAICTTNPASGVIMVDFDAEGFSIQPLSDKASATPHTVSAHMLYENSDPFILYEPGGHLDVTGSSYTAPDSRSVRVTGSKWVPSDRYTVKLEGARKAGYQTVSLTLVRDAHYVAHIQKWCDDIHRRTTEKVLDRLAVAPEDFSIELRLIGKNATLGAPETNATTPAEIGVLGIVTAKTEALAAEIGKMLNPYLLHHSLSEEEEMPTFAFPFSPAEIQRGAIYEFCLNHVMQLDDPMQAFRLEVIEVGP